MSTTRASSESRSANERAFIALRVNIGGQVAAVNRLCTPPGEGERWEPGNKGRES